MTRLDKLIQELCPNGVEYKKVKEIYQRLKGTPITAAKMKEISNESGEIKIFAGGKTVINANEKDIPNSNITRVPAVLVQSRGVIDVIYYDKPFTFKNEMWAYTSLEIISVKFLYYVLKNNIESFREAASGMGSLPQISLPVTEEFKMPVPPLPVQAEIVRILDSFTELTEKLTAELEARKKQYEYYRDMLLYFDVNEWECKCIWKNLGDVFSVSDYVANGSFADLRNNVTYLNSPNYAVLIRTADFSCGFQEEKFIYINEHAYNFLKKSQLFGGEIIINNIGAGVGTTFRCPRLNKKMSLAPNAVMISTPYNDFYYYWFQSKYGQAAIKKITSTSSLPKFNKTGLRSIQVPIPPIEEQKRIVSILDRFDKLCNDITEGLPAEISARQKQYEYYRNKLLTFKELT